MRRRATSHVTSRVTIGVGRDRARIRVVDCCLTTAVVVIFVDDVDVVVVIVVVVFVVLALGDPCTSGQRRNCDRRMTQRNDSVE